MVLWVLRRVRYVAQEDLEAADGVGSGKYTIGLGQQAMAFVDDREDINSICLTAVNNLLEKYDIDPRDVGRLEVGTESLVDKSKSAKTTLMQLFESHGNRDLEGATVMNACYGGTASFLNSTAWVESSAWDGRYAVFVAADIAVYEPGPARPTGGVGAVACLVGPDAPLVMMARSRSTHASDVRAHAAASVPGGVMHACVALGLCGHALKRVHCYTCVVTG